jgi:hypothetical protein
MEENNAEQIQQIEALNLQQWSLLRETRHFEYNMFNPGPFQSRRA